MHALAAETLDQISNVLLVLSEIAGGDYGSRVDLAGWEGTPIGLVAQRVNELAEGLAQAEATGEAARRELEEKIRIIENQRSAIDELSCPMIEVWSGVLCVPLMGGFDAARSAQMTDLLLHTVAERKIWYVIVDVTGMPTMDTATIDHFLRLVRSVRLLGAECEMSGLHPTVVQTIVAFGADLGDVRAHRTLHSALQRRVGDRGASAHS
jgi:rsbT co-antagonist protein RsbR